MTECERLKTCPFFTGRMTNMPAVAGLMKSTYCYGDKTQCARYQIAASGMPVPLDLLPNEVERAEQLLVRR